MISKFVREQKRYTQNNLIDIFECSEEKVISIIRKMKEYGLLKAVRVTDEQRDMSDLVDEDIAIADVEVGGNEYYYVFTFVGVVTVAGRILKCYPKYIRSNDVPKAELKQVLKVLERYNTSEQIIYMSNSSEESNTFNLLAVMLFLLNDYYENGSYINTQDMIEVNGSGEILWDKTINETFTIISNNRPFYPDLLTRKRINDDYDYIKRLHECILSLCSKELSDADLLDLFEIMPAELSDEELSDFGDTDDILYHIQNELNIQFNTRKQLLLKTMYSYIARGNHLDDIDGLSMFGTNSFNLVWETVCAEVMNNQLQSTLGSLTLPVALDQGYDSRNKLISLIEKPLWTGIKAEGGTFTKTASETLIPDLISIYQVDGNYTFTIFDAKYYCMQLDEGKPLRGQPGIESVSKQYLYQLAYKEFISTHRIHQVKNCFLLPTENREIINMGTASMEMLKELGLEDIQIRLLPVVDMYDHYINRTHMDLAELNL